MKRHFLAAAFSLCAGAALAAPVTYAFEAEFLLRTGDASTNSVADAAESLGSLSGSFTLDDVKLGDETGDTGASPNFTRSVFSVLDVSFDVLDTTGVEMPDVFRVEENDSNDNLALYQSTPEPANAFERLQFVLLDTSRTVFSSTDFPDTIDLSAFNVPQLYFFGRNARDEFERTTFTITSLAVAPVPLPAGLPLLLGGLALLGAARRRGSGA